ncbi:MAG: efflux RND transporter periplasmic adaptor subunit [Xanthobacteraceae bacterium]|nr:efflux RND transporter periplasmic adaptor subunit [Xanthobacteraceae bacterium]
MARKRVLIISTIVIAVAAAGWWYAVDHAPAERAGGKGGGGAPVPVTVALTAKQDLPIYLIGLGTVQASFTVGIRPQVDGKLEQVLFKEGEQVRKGSVLAKIDPRLYMAALEQAKARKAQDEAMLVSAQKDLVRSRTLVDKNFQTQQVVDQQQAKVEQLIASIDADKAAIDTAQTNLDYTSVVAPSDGRMGVRIIDPGNIVHASDSQPIATLTLTKPSAVMFTLSARSLNDVRDAMARGPVEIVAFSQDNKRELAKGTLLLIDNIVDQASATMRLKAMFPNEHDELWPGDFVNARLSLETRRDVLTIPSTAIQRGPEGIFAWVIDDKDVAHPRPITSGPSTGDRTIVTSGLSEGERVVVNGQYKLRPNAKVTVTMPEAVVAKQARAS